MSGLRRLGLALFVASAAVAQTGAQPGLDLRVYAFANNPSRVVVFAADQVPNFRAVIPTIDLSDARAAEYGDLADNFGAVISGHLKVDRAGLYGFRLTSDDGSQLRLNGQLVLDHDGPHGAEPKSTRAYLAAGSYDLQVLWYEGGGDASLKLEWQLPDGPWEVVPTRVLSTTTPFDGRTAPGTKSYTLPPAEPGAGLRRGLPPGSSLVPARPSAWYPRVVGLAVLPDGRPLVLEANSGQVVWASAGVPPQTLVRGLKDPLGLAADGAVLYIATERSLIKSALDARGEYYGAEKLYTAPAGQRIVAGPALTGNQVAIAIGNEAGGGGRLVTIDSRGKATQRASGLGEVVGLAAGPAGLFVVERVGEATTRLVRYAPGKWQRSWAAELPIAQFAGHSIQPLVQNDKLILGDGDTGLYVVTVGDGGASAAPWADGFESRPRAVLALPDHSLLVGGGGDDLRHPPFGLQRLVLGPAETVAIERLEARGNGLVVRFRGVPADGYETDPGTFAVRTIGPEPKALAVRSAGVLDNGRAMYLEVPGLASQPMVEVSTNIAPVDKDGAAPWTRRWFVLVDKNAKITPGPADAAANALSAEEKAAGWRSLFDGTDTAAWRGFRQQVMPPGWYIEDGWLKQRPGGGGGDIITRDQFGNFELEMDFVLSPGCNSGLMYRVTEEDEISWHTGPEVQILDDGQRSSTEIHSCGALYELFAPNENKRLNPAGTLNHFRIRLVNGHGEHWLNGIKIVDYQIGSEAWNKAYAASKFAEFPEFAKAERGHLVIQDHGTQVWYRNIKIREIAN